MLAVDKGFDLCTDHNYLIFFFDSTPAVANLSQTTLRKVLRWDICLSIYIYTCVHCPSSNNVWIDTISHWVPSPVIRRVVSIPVLPYLSLEKSQW